MTVYRTAAMALLVGVGLCGYNIGRSMEHERNVSLRGCPPGHHLVRTWNPLEKAEGEWRCEEPTCAVRVHPFEGVTCENKSGLLMCSCTPATEEVAQLRELKRIADDGSAACWTQRDAMLKVPACNAAWKAEP